MFNYPNRPVVINNKSMFLFFFIAGKYDDHEPLDLPHFYCTMSQSGFPHEQDIWKFAMGQPQANKIGPLGKRAGKS